MNHDAIIDRLRQVMKLSSDKDVDWDSVSGATRIEDLGFDSLSILDLIYDIQQEFGTEFEAQLLVNIQTVDELGKFLLQMQGQDSSQSAAS